MNSWNISVPGKIILLGEYAVLEGSPALSAAINRYCRISADFSPSDTFTFQAVNLNIPPLECKITDNGEIEYPGDISPDLFKQYRHVLAAFEHANQLTAGDIPPLHLSIDTSEFYLKESGQKLGLGSSAAVTVGCLATLLHGARVDLTLTDFLNLALKAHQTAQSGRGSGVDIATSQSGGVIQYQLKGDRTTGKIDSLAIPPDLHIIPIWTGFSASTSAFVEKIHQAKNENPEAYQTIIKSLRQLTSLGIDNLTGGRIEYFLEITDEYCNVMDQLGNLSGVDVISDIHREIGVTVRNAGGAYKPSGAGGGDLGLAFTGSDVVRKRILASLESSEFQVLDLMITKKGVIIEDSTNQK